MKMLLTYLLTYFTIMSGQYRLQRKTSAESSSVGSWNASMSDSTAIG